MRHFDYLYELYKHEDSKSLRIPDINIEMEYEDLLRGKKKQQFSFVSNYVINFHSYEECVKTGHPKEDMKIKNILDPERNLVRPVITITPYYILKSNN